MDEVIKLKRHMSLKEAVRKLGKDTRTIYRFKYAHWLAMTDRPKYNEVIKNVS